MLNIYISFTDDESAKKFIQDLMVTLCKLGYEGKSKDLYMYPFLYAYTESDKYGLMLKENDDIEIDFTQRYSIKDHNANRTEIRLISKISYTDAETIYIDPMHIINIDINNSIHDI